MARRGVLDGSKVDTLESSVAPAQFEVCAAVPRLLRVAGDFLMNAQR